MNSSDDWAYMDALNNLLAHEADVRRQRERQEGKDPDPDELPPAPKKTWRDNPAVKVYQVRVGKNRPDLGADLFLKTVESANGIPHECQYCHRSEKPIVFIGPQTMYKDDVGDFMCEDCADETREHWAEMWAEYNSGRMYEMAIKYHSQPYIFRVNMEVPELTEVLKNLEATVRMLGELYNKCQEDRRLKGAGRIQNAMAHVLKEKIHVAESLRALEGKKS